MTSIEKRLTQADIFYQNDEPELALEILNEVITDIVSLE